MGLEWCHRCHYSLYLDCVSINTTVAIYERKKTACWHSSSHCSHSDTVLFIIAYYSRQMVLFRAIRHIMYSHDTWHDVSLSCPSSLFSRVSPQRGSCVEEPEHAAHGHKLDDLSRRSNTLVSTQPCPSLISFIIKGPICNGNTKGLAPSPTFITWGKRQVFILKWMNLLDDC